MSTHAIGFWWTFVSQDFGPRSAVEVPACRSCRPRLQGGAWGRFARDVALAGVGAGLAIWLLGFQQGFWGTWAAVAVALVAFIPLLLWERIFPPIFDLTAYRRTVDYAFRDAAYADDFRRLNGADPDPMAQSPAAYRAGTVVAVALSVALAGLGLLFAGRTAVGLVLAGLGVVVAAFALKSGLTALRSEDKPAASGRTGGTPSE